VTLEERGRAEWVALYVLSLTICFSLDHPLLKLIPGLKDCPDSDAVALELLEHIDVVERWHLAVSA